MIRLEHVWIKKNFFWGGEGVRPQTMIGPILDQGVEKLETGQLAPRTTLSSYLENSSQRKLAPRRETSLGLVVRNPTNFTIANYFPENRGWLYHRPPLVLWIHACCRHSFTWVWRGFLFLRVLGMGYVILLWHSLSLPYNYFR